jgi:hypothetical protein
MFNGPQQGVISLLRPVFYLENVRTLIPHLPSSLGMVIGIAA